MVCSPSVFQLSVYELDKLISHSPVEERGELETRAHFFMEFEEHGQVNRDVSHVNRVTWPTQKVICPKSLPLAKHALLIKHTLPTATRCLYINNLHNIETCMTAVY